MSLLTQESAKRGFEENVLFDEARQIRHRHRMLVLSFVAGAVVVLLVLGLVFGGTWLRSSSSVGSSRAVSSTVSRLCDSPQSAALPTSAGSAYPASTFSASAISIRLFFCSARAAAGPDVKAIALFTNHTNRTLALSQCPSSLWFLLGIQNSVTPYDPAVTTELCRPLHGGSPFLPPGQSSMTVKVMTVYQECDRGATGGLQQGVPPCTASGYLPPLPQGRYETKAFIGGLPAGTAPPNTTSLVLVSARG
jgi:hypothetical protein